MGRATVTVPETAPDQGAADPGEADAPPATQATGAGTSEAPAEAGARTSAGAAADAGPFYDPSYRDRLVALVAGVLGEHGPLREDRLVRRVARLHGFRRAGRGIRERVLGALPPGCVRTRDGAGGFVRPPGADPAAWDRLRDSPPGSALDPAEPPLQELAALARRHLGHAEHDEAVPPAMRDACGPQRLRDAAERAAWRRSRRRGAGRVKRDPARGSGRLMTAGGGAAPASGPPRAAPCRIG